MEVTWRWLDAQKLPHGRAVNQSSLFHNYGNSRTGILARDTCLESKAVTIYVPWL